MAPPKVSELGVEYGPIKLTSEITVRPVQQMGGDHMVVAAARVSTTGSEALAYAEGDQEEENFGLINYLIKHRHGSPFEHGALTFFVHAPIFVFREWHRHRVGFSYNEESGRYKQLEPVFWVPRRDRKMVRPEGYKAARPKFEQLESDFVYDEMIERSRLSYQVAYNAYWLELQFGIANEVARRHLPVATYSSCWVTCNPRSLMHFLSLRTHVPSAQFVSYPQAEIAEAAEVCEQLLEQGWPLTHTAFVNNGRVAP